MKTKVKRLTALILALAMCMSLLCTGAWAAEIPESGDEAVTIAEETEEVAEETDEKNPDGETPEEEVAPDVPDSSEEEELPSDETDESGEELPEEPTEEVEETVKEQQSVTGFADFDINVHSLYYPSDKKPSLKNLLSKMPETLEVYLDGSSETTAIPVSWYCVDGDYEASEDYYFQFSPQWDEEKYVLAEGVDLLTEAPYIGVFLVVNSSSGLLNATVTGNANETTVYHYLTGTMGLNAAAACGIMANIQKESSFNPTALGDSGTSYGLCQWHSTRYTRLKTYCSNNGYDYTTVNGQMHYLQYELTNYYPSVLSYMKSVANTADGAYDAGYYWCYHFEVPANTAATSVTRGNLAKNSYWPVYRKTSISNCTITLSASSYTYTGNENKPAVTVKMGTTTLTNGTDYTVAYSNNVNAGTGTVTITGKGNYEGTATKTFAIAARNVSECTVTTPSARYVYTGKARNPGVTVKYGSVVLKNSTDYTVTYSDNVAIGTGKITITGQGNFTGTKVKTYEIVPAAPVIASFENTSLGIKLTWGTVAGAKTYGVFRMADGESEWTKLGTTAALTYQDTTAKAGVTYQYCLKAYDGSIYSDKSTAVKLVRLAQPAIASVSSLADKSLTVKWSVISGVGGYQVDYSTSSTFSSYTRVKIADSSKSSATIALTLGGKYYVRLRTYKTVNGVASYSCWSSVKTVSVTADEMMPETPVITSFENTSLGIKLTWEAAANAKTYGVFRMAEGESEWTKLGTTAALTYKDTGAKAGVTYQYCLKAYNGSIYSDKSPAVKLVRLEQPAIASVSNAAAGALTVKWSAISGVGGYQVDYSTSSTFSSYTRVKIADSSKTSAAISGLTKGTKYYVRLRTYKTVSGVASYSYWSSVKTITVTN